MNSPGLVPKGLAILCLVATCHAFAGETPKIEPKAKEILVKASEYLKSAETINLKGLVTSEEVTGANEKYQFDSVLEGSIVRPNKVYLRKIGYENFALWFDGGGISVMDTANMKYSKIAVSGDLTEASKKLDEIGIETPFAGLLSPELGKDLEKRIKSGKYMGETQLGELRVEHVAIRQDDVDWQIWVDKQSGGPRKMVITSKTLTGSPSHSVILTELKVGEEIPDSTFKFVAPKEAQEVPVLSFGDPG